MTQLAQTLNNYSLKPLSNFLLSVYKTIEAAQLARATAMVRQKMLSHKMYRETYNELSKLTDKELKDIGLSRGDIHSVAMEAYFDNRSPKV